MLLLAAGSFRVAPLQGEMTLSFLGRIADRYGLTVQNLLSSVTDVAGQQSVAGALRDDSEVFLNAAARGRVSALCHVPQADLRRALPAWMREEPLGLSKERPTARLHNGVETVAAWGPACPSCVATRTGRMTPARVYLAAHQRVCPRHRYWLMSLPGSEGRVIGLAGCPEVVRAQEDHRRLLCRSPVAGSAFEVAEAVTAWWWAQQWPEEHLWPMRLDAAMPEGEDPRRWRILGRDLVTYPETVALAMLLASPAWRLRIAAGGGGHLPYRLADVPCVPSELGHRLWRPWLTERLAACTHGPLFAWAYQCIRTKGGGADDEQRLWQVPLAFRPRLLADVLAGYQHRQTAGTEGLPAQKRLRGHSAHAESAFATGLAHARTYAAQHGHLATQRDTRVGSFALGKWVHNQQTHALALPAEKAAALKEVDPWWNIPWSVKWQRSYYRARDHVRRHGPLTAADGFPDTHVLTGEWLYLQCTDYDSLHPEQRRLMADIGLTAQAAASARPRRTSRTAGIDTALVRARAFVAEHGCLALATKNISYQGFPLGQWLNAQRSLGRRQDEAGPHLQVLDEIDVWWNPPWPLAWQRTWHRIRAHVRDRRQEAAGGHWPDGSDGWATWLSVQCIGYKQLRPPQQHLLAEIGITAETAAVRPHEVIAQLCGTAPGLDHARTYAAQHGHLAIPQSAYCEGFPLGRWLSEQRRKAREHHRGTGGRWPVSTLLAALDPWWSPTWSLEWQRNWNRVRKRSESACAASDGGSTSIADLEEELAGWLRRQCADYGTLHPEQHHLLARIGITAETARAAQPPAPSTEPDLLDTALAHARTYADRYGHIAAPTSTILNGFRLGKWLAWQRRRAHQGRLSSARAKALAMIDPWWNPAWPLQWQQAYHRLCTAAAGADGVTPTNHPRGLYRWIRVQQESWEHLHPGQQDLLTALGITPHTPVGERPAPATRSYPVSPGLDHARAYAVQHGHLTPDKHTRQDGFPLGTWLSRQRRNARAGTLSATTAAALASLDPWWNPPWPYTWHRTYQQYRTAINGSTPLPDALHRWIAQQRARWHTLHPHQQHLLTHSADSTDHSTRSGTP
ncbi:Helicase associated domain protein [Streptomyces cyaneofuscatus]|uniref:Helicase associated domain protein n=1 Tax=Streptomyces cyaneofuscatus TaxID=66883 RepID=UPI00341771EF